MKNKNLILRNLKENLHQKFLFIPHNKTFVGNYIDICLEFFFRKKLTRLAVGVVDELIEKKVLAPQVPKVFRFDFEGATFYDIYLKNYDGRTYSRGFSTDIHEACAKALGEVFERQFTEFRDDENNRTILYSSMRDLQQKKVSFVDPREYAQPVEQQRKVFSKIFTYNENEVFAWVQAKKLSEDALDAEGIYISAQDAYWGFGYSRKEPNITSHGTSGCGGGYTYTQALESALLEVLHRDTFFRYWYFNKKPYQIDIHTIPDTGKTALFLKRLKEEGFTVHLLDMTETAGLPTITAVIQRENTGWFIGASSSRSKEGACHRALQEAFSIYMWTFQQAKYGKYDVNEFLDSPVRGGFIDERITGRERCLLWGSKYYLEEQDQFLVQGKVIPFEEVIIPKDCNIQSCMVQKFGEGYVVEAHNEILETYNYYSVKVIFPKVYRLFLVEKYARPLLQGNYPQNNTPHPFP